ncbi:hypothetical protein [Hufsiella ginkgonis]|uniref:Uncharacterized protein n=1 Tax=Hufsiella ginkgonis TaxID=2695274 RepID=A0A7K1XVL6_9SPHI|nr:hypothetical protein [Hufsiella ginkgonis]MXV14809.1 hypothetical protein [Hufsiella ginkgonis]
MLQQNDAQPLPYFFVGGTVTNQRKARFRATKYPLLAAAIGKPDTRSVWYSREHIEKLLWEMNHADADGLRVYFGAYAATDTHSDQLCLLMVMTVPNTSTGGHTDITIEDAADYRDRAIDEETPRDFNVGSPCPPACDDDIGCH